MTTVCICTPQDPFKPTMAELLAERIREALAERDFEAEVIRVPLVRSRSKSELAGACLVWRLLDLTESNGRKIDLVIATGFPACVVKHQNKVVWLTEALWEAGGSITSTTTGARAEESLVRDKVVAIFRRSIGQAHRVFAVSSELAEQLRRDYRVETKLLVPPADGPESESAWDRIATQLTAQ
jgi:hypothetical protein